MIIGSWYKSVPIDDVCVGDHWTAKDEAQLARLIAIVAMGQAAYAAHILSELLPASPAFTDDDLCREAWFDSIASKAVSYLNELGEEAA